MRSAAAYATARPSSSRSRTGAAASTSASTTAYGIVGEDAATPRPATSAYAAGAGCRAWRASRSATRSCGWRQARRLLRALGRGGLLHERRQRRDAAVSAPTCVERFERLVGEVDRVATVDEHVIGDRGEHHRVRPRRGRRAVERGGEHALGPVGRRGCRRTGGTSSREPLAGDRRRSRAGRRPSAAGALAVSRGEERAGRARARAARSSASRWGSTFAIATSTVRPAPHPVLRLRDAVLDAGATIAVGPTPWSSSPSTAFADHEREVVFEAVAQPPLRGARPGRRSARRARRTRRRRRCARRTPVASSAQRSSVQPDSRSNCA